MKKSARPLFRENQQFCRACREVRMENMKLFARLSDELCRNHEDFTLKCQVFLVEKKRKFSSRNTTKILITVQKCIAFLRKLGTKRRCVKTRGEHNHSNAHESRAILSLFCVWRGEIVAYLWGWGDRLELK